jgi:hypothetical protein
MKYIDKLKNQRELIKYIALRPISSERYTRLNDYFSVQGKRLGARDYYNGHRVYASLYFTNGNNYETYINYLERINIIQNESQLLSFPFELENSIESLLIQRNSGNSLPEFTEFPLIISGDLNRINHTEDNLFVIKDKLGAYFPILNIIIIDQEKITAISNDYTWDDGFYVWPDYNSNYEIVLRHEIGHWISHEILIDGKFFNDDEFRALKIEIHEFWAQIIAYNLLDKRKDFQNFMNLLSKNQDDIYQTYDRFSNELTPIDIRNLLSIREEITNTSDLIKFITEIKKKNL